MTNDYLCELALPLQAESHTDAALQAEGWAQDPFRPGAVWRITNSETGDSQLVDIDEIALCEMEE